MASILTLLTDFGEADGFVGIMKGVILGIVPDARLVDLSHQVPPQQIMPAALLLRLAMPFFPRGTVHLVVVDPGVGTARRPIAIETDNALLVGPDNGVLAPAAEASGIRRVHAIESPEVRRHVLSNTFHGRDLFAPAAAHLAAGFPIESLGPALVEPQPLALPEPQILGDRILGEVVYIDHFGNLITNIDSPMLATFREAIDSVSIAGVTIAGPSNAYAAVPSGELLSIINSWDVLEIAARNGNAAARLRVSVGAAVEIRRKAPA